MKIALDLDGTIVTSKERQISLLKTLAKAHSITIDGDAIWFLKRKGLNNRKSLSTHGFPSCKIDLICNQWERLIETFPWLYFDNLIVGTVDVLVSWRSYGHTLHLLSARSNPLHGFLQLQALGIRSLFHTVTFVNPKTPNAKVPALKELNPNYYIGDTERDYHDAILANVVPVLVSTGIRDRQFLYLKTGESPFSDLFSVAAVINKSIYP